MAVNKRSHSTHFLTKMKYYPCFLLRKLISKLEFLTRHFDMYSMMNCAMESKLEVKAKIENVQQSAQQDDTLRANEIQNGKYFRMKYSN